MKRSMIETLLGAVVLLLAGFFVVTAYQSSTIASSDGYMLRATFDKIDGVGVGTDVKISGIKVGSITSLHLDPETYLATIEIIINDVYRLPTDTVAVVQSEGLLGGSYLSLVPGGNEEMLAPGAAIQYTQAPTSLTDLIGRFVFSATGQGKSSATGASSGGDQSPGEGTAPAAPAAPENAPEGTVAPSVEGVTPEAQVPLPGQEPADPQTSDEKQQQGSGGFGLLK
jgi:phospholipid/cholesterol/gamma-HCH transport system substrate-binding protein